MLINSNLYNEASGSIGSLTARPSAGGISLITKKKTNYTNTPQQQIIKGAISEANYLWQSFTPAIRKGWDDYARTRPKINASGKIYYYSGLQEFTNVAVLYKSHNAESDAYKSTYPKIGGYIEPAEIVIDYSKNLMDIYILTLKTRPERLFTSINLANSLTLRKPREAYTQKQDFHAHFSIREVVFINITTNKKCFMKFIFHDETGRTSKPIIQTLIT